MKGNSVVGCRENLRRNEVTGTSWTTMGVVAVLSVICAGRLFNNCDVRGVRKALKYFGLDSHLNAQDRYKMKLGT